MKRLVLLLVVCAGASLSAQTFPTGPLVSHVIVDSCSGCGGGPIGQTTMAASAAVVIASDQSAVHTICDSGCGSPPATADRTAFVAGTTNVTPIAAVVDDVATTTVAENAYGAPRMTTNRVLLVDGSAVTQPVTVTNTVDVTGSLVSASIQTTPVGQQNMANSMPVVLANNQSSIPVTGTFWQATQPVSGSFFQATQPVSGTFWQATQPVSGTFWQATQPVSGTVTATPPTESATTGSLTGTACPGIGCVDLAITNSGSGSVQLTGTWVATVQFEASMDGGTNFFSMQVLTLGASSSVTSATSNGTWVFGAAGFNVIRIRASAYTSGTATVAVRVSPGSQVVRTTAAAANASVNVSQIAGVTPSLNTGVRDAGTLRVTVATNDVVPVTGTFWQATQPVSGTVTTTPPANASTNVAQVAGTTTDTNSGVKSAGTLRVVLATDQPALTNKLLVTPDSVALPANQSVNVAQIGGTNTVTGGVAGILAVGGNVANAVAATANPVPVGGIFTTTPATLTTGQTATMQFTAAQNLKHDLTTVGGTAVSTGTGAGGAGIPRVTISNDSALAANQSVNVAQMGGVATAMGQGIATTGTQRVALAQELTYSAGTTAKTATAAGTGPFFSMCGSATKTIRVQRFTVSGTVATAAVWGDVVLKRTSTATSGGTATALTMLPYDSTSAAGTATPNFYTVLATAGTSAGVIVSSTQLFPITAISATLQPTPAPLFYVWRDTDSEAVTLRGTAQCMEANFGTTTTNAPTLTVSVVWTEK